MTDSHAVIAVPATGGWKGRYLHHDPSLTDTGTLLRELVNLRLTRRRHGLDYAKAYQALITDHPAGWAALGSTTRTDPTRKARRAPAPIGRCLCHEDDGSPRPALIASALRALHQLEHDDGQDGIRRPRRHDPTDGSPWLIRGDQHEPLPEGTDRIYLVAGAALRIYVRDGARTSPSPGSYLEAGAVPWSTEQAPDWPGIEATAARIRNRTLADLHATEDARVLAAAARRLAAIPEHDDLVLHILRETARRAHAPRTALAEAAGVLPIELPGHLTGLSRAAQVALVQAAAHRLDPANHRPPTPATDTA